MYQSELSVTKKIANFYDHKIQFLSPLDVSRWCVYFLTSCFNFSLEVVMFLMFIVIRRNNMTFICSADTKIIGTDSYKLAIRLESYFFLYENMVSWRDYSYGTFRYYPFFFAKSKSVVFFPFLATSSGQCALSNNWLGVIIWPFLENKGKFCIALSDWLKQWNRKENFVSLYLIGWNSGK